MRTIKGGILDEIRQRLLFMEREWPKVDATRELRELLADAEALSLVVDEMEKKERHKAWIVIERRLKRWRELHADISRRANQ